LVGLNLFLTKMAQQFHDVLGIRGEDPMLTSMGIDPRDTTEQAILDQAKNRTADVRLDVDSAGGVLSAQVTGVNKTGHKFPSGVGFRRAFVELRVLDANGDTLWASGRTDKSGVIVDENNKPIDGELWWDQNCARRPTVRHQPHYETIDRQ